MTVITPDKFPEKGGWVFRQPQMNWTNPMAMVGFKASVDAILKLRKANPALSVKHKLSTDRDDIEKELIEFQYVRLKISKPQDNFFYLSRSLSLSGEAVADAVSRLKGTSRKMYSGVRTLAEWLGSGGVPVKPEQAESRSMVCAECPQNKKGDLTSFFTKPVSDLIRRQVEERNEMKLSTSRDSELGVCDACGCPLKLKVHVPLEEIKNHMQAPEKSRLDVKCWILSES